MRYLKSNWVNQWNFYMLTYEGRYEVIWKFTFGWGQKCGQPIRFHNSWVNCILRKFGSISLIFACSIKLSISIVMEHIKFNLRLFCYVRCYLLSQMVKLFKNGPSKICGRQPYHFSFFKHCLPQILLGPFLNTLTQILEEMFCPDYP